MMFKHLKEMLVALCIASFGLYVVRDSKSLNQTKKWNINTVQRLKQNQTSRFDQASAFAYRQTKNPLKSCPRNKIRPKSEESHEETCIARIKFELASYTNPGSGGLSNEDRTLIGDIYYNAESVFEFGIGESTRIADLTKLPRYVGVDSDSEWVSTSRKDAATHFRFYFADIGETKQWGYPNAVLKKSYFNYQLAPLKVEEEAFDVYMVDGRWRVACVLISFLHAMSHGGDMSKIQVLMHDFERKGYHVVMEVANIVKRSHQLVALNLKKGVSEDELFSLWETTYEDQMR